MPKSPSGRLAPPDQLPPLDQLIGVRRKGIQSVEIGVGVLNAVVRMGAPAGVTDIARASGLSTSQAHRYLASFVNCGFLRQDPQNGLYDLAAGALRIGMAAMGPRARSASARR